MKKTSCFFLFLLVLSVYAQKKKLPVISKAEELKTVKGKQIIWKKDGAKMAIVRPYKPAGYKEEKMFNRLGEPITKKVKVDEVLPLWFDTTEVTVLPVPDLFSGTKTILAPSFCQMICLPSGKSVFCSG